jgi:hypothetical protein
MQPRNDTGTRRGRTCNVSSFRNILIAGGKRPGREEAQGRDCDRDTETNREHFGQYEISFHGEQTRPRLSRHACFAALPEMTAYDARNWLIRAAV